MYQSSPVKLFNFSFFNIGGILQFLLHSSLRKKEKLHTLKKKAPMGLQNPPNIEKGKKKREITSQGCHVLPLCPQTSKEACTLHHI